MTPVRIIRVCTAVSACVLIIGGMAATVDWKNGRPGTVVMPSPPAALDVPLKEPTNAPFRFGEITNISPIKISLKGGGSLFAHRSGTNWYEVSRIDATNTPPPMPVAPMPSFSDGVRIASALFSRNPDFDKLFTVQEKVAMCARVWELERKGAK